MTATTTSRARILVRARQARRFPNAAIDVYDLCPHTGRDACGTAFTALVEAVAAQVDAERRSDPAAEAKAKAAVLAALDALTEEPPR